MGSKGSKQVDPTSPEAIVDRKHRLNHLTTDSDISSALSTAPEDLQKRKLYQNLVSAYNPTDAKKNPEQHAVNPKHAKNLIQVVYEEDFDNIDHVQALRLPPMVVKELRDGVTKESMRRCHDLEKTMARCLQDKMWTAWKCQKERDLYYSCLHEKQKDNSLLTDYRWKYTMGTFHGEIIARNNIMKRLWYEHHPEREIPHQWVDSD